MTCASYLIMHYFIVLMESLNVVATRDLLWFVLLVVRSGGLVSGS